MNLLSSTIFLFFLSATHVHGHLKPQVGFGSQNLARMIRDTETNASVCDIGTRQTPIDIDHCCRTKMESNLAWKGYDNKKALLELINTGARAEIKVKGAGQRPMIKGGPLEGVYVFQDLHFHWGKMNENGTEHSFKGKYGAMEAHFTHYNTKYASYAEARSKKDGIASIAVLFKLCRKSNKKMLPLIEKLEKIVTSKSSVDLMSSELLWIPEYLSHTNYVSYPGSLASPPCFEVVTWIVMREMPHISAEQVEKFRLLLNNNGEKITELRREQKPTNGRKIICPKC